MSAKQIKVPKGWRKLRAGVKRRRGDRHYMATNPTNKRWLPVWTDLGAITEDDIKLRGAFIRRLPKKRASK